MSKEDKQKEKERSGRREENEIEQIEQIKWSSLEQVSEKRKRWVGGDEERIAKRKEHET